MIPKLPEVSSPLSSGVASHLAFLRSLVQVLPEQFQWKDLECQDPVTCLTMPHPHPMRITKAGQALMLVPRLLQLKPW